MATAQRRPEHSAGYPSLIEGIPESDWARLQLDEGDLRLIGNKRGEHNRLGFAVQLTGVRYLGRFQTDIARIPDDVVLRVGEQLDVADPLAKIRLYADNPATVQAHAREITDEDGWTSFPEGRPRLAAHLEARLEITADSPRMMTLNALSWLRENRVLLPSQPTVRALAVECCNRAEDAVVKKLGGKLTPAQIRTIDQLMDVPAGERTSRLDRLRHGVGVPSWTNFAKALTRAEDIRALGFTGVDVSDISERRLAHLADHAMAERVTRLKQQSGKRAAVLAAVKHLEKTALDDAIDMLDKLISGHFIARPKKWADKVLIDAYPTFAPAGTLAAHALLAVLELVAERIDRDTGEIADPHTDTDSTRAALETVADRHSLTQAAKIFLKYMPARDSDTDEARRARAAEQYPAVRKLVPVLAGRVPFGATPAGHLTLTALHTLPLLLDREEAGSDDIDATLLKGSWARLVHGGPGTSSDAVNLPAYALCVLETLYRQLCKREIFVDGSFRWSDLRTALLSQEEWEQFRQRLLTSLGLPDSPAAYLDQVRTHLHADLTQIASRLPDGAQVRLADGNLNLPNSQAQRASKLSRQVESMLPKVELPQVVLEVLRRTGGVTAFTTRNGESAPYTEFELSVAAVLVGQGCNLGLEAVASDKEALKIDRLDGVSRTYVRAETIEALNTLMLQEQAGIPVAGQWNGGQLASVDGMQFVIPTPQPPLRIAPEGNTELSWMTVLTEQAIQLSGRMVSGRPSAALEALSTLTAHRSQTTTPDAGHPDAIVAEAGTHEDLVFGLLTLSGYSYQPAPHQIQDTRLWRIEKAADYGPLQDATRRRIDLAPVAEHWDEILRVIGSIHYGTITAHTALRVLTRNGKPTSLGAAIAAFGRIAKTRHLLRLYDNPDFRRRIEAQSRLHKERHELAKRICHGLDGPFPEYYPGLEDRLGALGLVLNCVALFNTIYIQKILDKLRAQGQVIFENEIRQLSPLIHRHINMRGRFHFELTTESMFVIPGPGPVTTADGLSINGPGVEVR
ncbi:Tn3 family transposase [Streptomyces sp. NPDC058335]|uniref:Tn3 family transposase n=1 Tax=Streptomyces sp. NPDC058335 TaxID=3346451 RepID=UPI00364658D6